MILVMEPVVIGDAERTLSFADTQFHGALPADYLSVAVTGPDMSASRQVYAGWDGGFTALAAFFTDLLTSGAAGKASVSSSPSRATCASKPLTTGT